MSYFDAYRDIIFTPLIFVNILVLVNTFNIFLMQKFFKKDPSSAKMNLSTFLSLCIVFPILEESLFRFTLQKHLEYILSKTISTHITCLLFGLVHVANYRLVVDTLGKKMATVLTINQSILTIILAYILSINDSMFLNIILHSYYNTTSLFILSMLSNFVKIKYPNEKKQLYLTKRCRSFPEVTVPTYGLKYEWTDVDIKVHDDHRETQNKLMDTDIMYQTKLLDAMILPTSGQTTTIKSD